LYDHKDDSSNNKNIQDDSFSHCTEVEFKLRWTSSVGSPVLAPPIFFPRRRGNQEMQLFLSTYYQYIELIDSDGFKPWGWPISFEDSSFQSSPILHDIDSDGNIDIGVVDKNANLYWIRTGDFGEYLENYHIQIPKLKIKRFWAEHLDPSFVDSNAIFSMFDRKRKRYNDPEDSNSKDELIPKQRQKGESLKKRRRRSSPFFEGQGKNNGFRNRFAKMTYLDKFVCLSTNFF